MRLIPKNSKIKLSIYKGFSLLDLVMIFIFFIFGTLIGLSNLPSKYFFLMLYACIVVMMFVKSDGDERNYIGIRYTIKYFASNKKYSLDATNANKHINAVLPYTDILEDGTIVFGTQKQPLKTSKPINEEVVKENKNEPKKNENEPKECVKNETIENQKKKKKKIVREKSTLKSKPAQPDYYAKVIEVKPIEFSLLGEYGQNLKIKNFANIFNKLTDSQHLEVIKLDRPLILDNFVNDLNKKVAFETNKIDSDKSKLKVLNTRLSQMKCLDFEQKIYKPYFYIVLYDETINGLTIGINEIYHSIDTDCEMECEILSAEQVALFLKYNYCRNFDERDIKNFKREEYVNFIKPKNIEFKRLEYQIDDVKAFTFTVADYPLYVANAWASELFNIDNTKVVMHIRNVDTYKAIKRIDKAIIELTTRDGANKASEIISTETHIETMANLLISLQNENEKLFDCTMTVTGYNYENLPMKQFQKQIKQRFNSLGFRPNILFCRQIDGFISSNISRRSCFSSFERGINGDTLSAMFPFVQAVIIEDKGLALGASDGLPVIVDFWKRGKNFKASNIVIVGQPGGGKSYFIKLLMSLMHSENCRIFILDPENEYTKLSKSLNGTIIDVGSSRWGILNPFHIYDILTETGEPAPPKTIYLKHLRFIEDFLKTILPDIDSYSMEILNNCVTNLYAKKGITENTDTRNFTPEQFPIFQDLYEMVVEMTNNTTNEHIKSNLEKVEQYLIKFAKGGRLSDLWNGYSTLKSNSAFTVFNFQSLFTSKNSPVAKAQMLLITKFMGQEIINIREMNRNRTDGESIIHPILFFDEGYQFIDEHNPIALDFVFEQFKKIRKYSGMAGFITQNISDFNKPNIYDKTIAILKNNQYTFVFPLREGDVKDLVELYESVSPITEQEQYEVANNGTGRVFMISSPKSRLCFQIVAPEEIRDMFDDNTGA